MLNLRIFFPKIKDIAESNYLPAYIEMACFLNNTYRMFDESSDAVIRTNENMVSYYQWTPLFCIIAILLNLFPSFVWKGCSPSYRTFPEISRNYNFIRTDDEKNAILKRASLVIRNVIAHSVNPQQLANTYIAVKFLTVAVLILDLFLFSAPIGTLNIFKIWTQDHNAISKESKFPIVTKCFVNVTGQSPSGYNEYTATCVLPNNILHFYFFCFCIHWFLFLFIVAVVNLIHWLLLIYNKRWRVKYILSHLHCSVDAKDLYGFVDTLGPDGVFMIIMTSKNGSDLFASMLTENLLLTYTQSRLAFDE